MKFQTKACVIVIVVAALAMRVFAGPPPQAVEETYKRVAAKIAEKQAYERYLRQTSGGR